MLTLRRLVVFAAAVAVFCSFGFVTGVAPELALFDQDRPPDDLLFSKREPTWQVLIDLSHGTYFNDYAATDFYGALIEQAEQVGLTVTAAEDFHNLKAYDVVILTFPQWEYSDDDVKRLRNYLNSGGIVLVFAEWSPYYGYSLDATNGMLLSLGAGVTIVPGTVIHPSYFDTYEYWPVVTGFEPHCLTDGLHQIIHPRSGYLLLDNADSTLSYSDVDSYSDETVGPLPMMATANPLSHPDWKLFVAADSDLFSSYNNDYVAKYNNAQLAINLLLWCPCSLDSDCDDSLFCNGAEVCSGDPGICLSGEEPCPDDGLFCNGEEGCDEMIGACIDPEPPCDPATEDCNEDQDRCESFDIDDDDDDDDESPTGEKDNWPDGKVSGGCCDQ